MSNVVALLPRDRLRQDAAPIAAIYRSLGTDAAEQVVTRALAELTLATAAISAQMRDGEVADLPRQLRRLQRMADHLGMVTFATITCDLRQCVEIGDGTATYAVWARLQRAAERSLAPVGLDAPGDRQGAE
jgi:hypothetical protein